MTVRLEVMDAIETIEVSKPKELSRDLYFIVLTPGELALKGASVEVRGELLSPEQVFERGQKDQAFFYTPLGILNASSEGEREKIVETVRKERSEACVTFSFYMFRYPNGSIPNYNEKMLLQGLGENRTVSPGLSFRVPRKGEERKLGLAPEYQKYLQIEQPNTPGELVVALKTAVNG